MENPRYTGFAFFGRWTKHETLLDPDDVAAGHVVRFRRSSPDRVVRSRRPAHPEIVSVVTFTQAQLMRRSRAAGGMRGRGKLDRRRFTTTRPYRLRGRFRCVVCERKMLAAAIRDTIYYHCLARTIAPGSPVLADHPRAVNVREDQVIGWLNKWIMRVYDRDHIDETVKMILAENPRSTTARGRRTRAEAKLKDAETRLRRHWRSPWIIPTWLPDDRFADWSAAHEELTALPDEDTTPEIADRRVELAERLTSLDGASTPRPLEIVGQSMIHRGQAAEGLELLTDAVGVGADPAHYDRRCPPEVAAELRLLGATPGFRLVDVPARSRQRLRARAFGKDVFLDYCHHTVESLGWVADDIAGEVAAALGSSATAEPARPNRRCPPASSPSATCCPRCTTSTGGSRPRPWSTGSPPPSTPIRPV